jgi:hypothetical protein
MAAKTAAPKPRVYLAVAYQLGNRVAMVMQSLDNATCSFILLNGRVVEHHGSLPKGANPVMLEPQELFLIFGNTKGDPNAKAA